MWLDFIKKFIITVANKINIKLHDDKLWAVLCCMAAGCSPFSWQQESKMENVQNVIIIYASYLFRDEVKKMEGK